MKLRYVIQCGNMAREEVVIVASVRELLDIIEDRIAHHGPIHLLYLVARA